MQHRFHQLIFVVSLLVVCWLGMMAIHELGHVVGALLTGGNIERVVIHPLTISRTDVNPNPNPLLVVWMGPVVGCVLPLLAGIFVPKQLVSIHKISTFFVGFCLIANGAYIAIGSVDRIGDCGEMLKHGSPQWLLVAFGIVAAFAGLASWHQLGSLKQFLTNPQVIEAKLAYGVMLLAVSSAAVGLLFSST